MNDLVEKENINKHRIGTFDISEKFKRKHEIITQIIVKYQKYFDSLGDMPKQTIHKSPAGRPVEEYLLNHNQLLLLMSFQRSSEVMNSVKSRIIKTTGIAKAVELLDSFDFGEMDVKYVYAIIAASGKVKIGISNDPERRLKEIQTVNPETVKLFITKKAEGQGYESEVQLHCLAKDYRLHNEWLSEEAIKIIETINAN